MPMNAHTESLGLVGGAGAIEAARDEPAEGVERRGTVVIAHPHPLFGGTMDNKVAQTLARTFLALGYVAVRMNFRGVGKSEGVHDHGQGETDDMALLLQHMRGQYPDLPLALGGFSFGTFVQASLQQRLLQDTPAQAAERLALVGTAAGKWPMPTVPANTILIHGEQDDTITLQMVFDWARPLEIPVIVIPGADHFFHRRLNPIKNLVTQMWRRDA